jgi:hypothetical protein
VGDDHPGKKEKRKRIIIQKKDLAKFGYILDMKMKIIIIIIIIIILLYSWLSMELMCDLLHVDERY